MVFCKKPKLGYFVRKIVTADNQKLPNLVTLRWTQVDKDFCWTKWNISANVRSAIQIDQTLCVFLKKVSNVLAPCTYSLEKLDCRSLVNFLFQ